MNNILTRRTIRKYSTRDVYNSMLSDLLAKASRTQTMGNMQLYSVVVTRSDEGKKALAPAHFNQPTSEGPPTGVCKGKPTPDMTISSRSSTPPPMHCSIRRHSATLPKRQDWDCASWERRCICRR